MDKGSGKNLLAAGKVWGQGSRGSKGQCGVVVAYGPGPRLRGPRSQLLRLAAAPMSVVICSRGCGRCLLFRAPCTWRSHRTDSTDHRCLAYGEHGTLSPHTHTRSLGLRPWPPPHPPTPPRPGLLQQPHPSAAPGHWCVLPAKGPAHWHQQGTNHVGSNK